MARRYARDNRGRFASGGGGATARGGRLRTAAGNKRKTQTMQASAAPKGTIGKPRGLKPGAIKAKPTAKSAAAKRPRINDAKVSRVVSRVNAVTRNADTKSGVKRMNAVEVGVRAKAFLARKAGGVSSINAMGQKESFAAVSKAIKKPPRYSTQQPNRNKPGKFNALGQDKARVKAAQAALTTREKIAQSNAAKPKTSSTAASTVRRGIGPRAVSLPPASVPGYVSGRRIAGTIAKPKTTAKPPNTVARTRSQAKAVQRFRRNAILDRTRNLSGRNSGLKRSDTGMRQLSLTGPGKTLYSFKRTKLSRKPR